MSECLSIEIREQLPEFLHGRLDAIARAAVESHLISCDDCRSELATLRAVREAFTRVAPMIDTATIVRALPKARPRRSSRHWMMRVAAVISFISVGGLSIGVAHSFLSNINSGLAVDTTPGVPSADSVMDTDSGRAPTTSPATLTVGGEFSDLGTDQLEALIGALETVEAAPSATPDIVLVQAFDLSTGAGSQ